MGVIAAAVAALRGDEPLPGPGGRLPEYLREFYTYGGCEELADAMHEITGWPVVVVGDRGGVVGWVHAGVQVPSGEILDAGGRHSPEEWLESWVVWVDAYGEGVKGYDPDLVDVIPREYFAQV